MGRFGESRRIVRTTRRQMLSSILAFSIAAAGVWVGAHEGHGGLHQRPTYRDVRAGSGTFRVGFAALPVDPLVGEDVRFEFRVLRVAPTGGAQEPVVPHDPQILLADANGRPFSVSR